MCNAENIVDAELAQTAALSGDGLAEANLVILEWCGFMGSEPPPFDWIITDIIAKGMKGDLNAKSKQWKSFFGMQLALAVSSGMPFLNMQVPQARKVLYVNLEIIERGAWERGAAMQSAMGTMPTKDMLYIMNLRSMANQLRTHEAALVLEIKRLGIDLVILDPRYKLIGNGEDENTPGGLRGVLEFRDKLAEVAAVLMIGHDPKGDVTGKSMTDRGAGSYIAGADYDFSFALSPHELDGYTVLSTSCRYRKPPRDLTIRFDIERQIFEADVDIPAEVRHPKRGGNTNTPEKKAHLEQKNLIAFENAVRNFIDTHGLMGKGTFDVEIGKLQEAQAVGGEKKRNTIIKSLFERGIIKKTDEWEKGADGKKRKKGGKNYMVGAPDKVKRYEEEFDTLDT